MPPQISSGRCTACGICQDVCPGDILYLRADRVEVRYADECSNCGICQIECPSSAIEIRFGWNVKQPPVELISKDGRDDA